MKEKIRVTVEIALDDHYPLKKDEREWYEKEILKGNRTLIVHSNEIGDYIGEVTKVYGVQWLLHN